MNQHTVTPYSQNKSSWLWSYGSWIYNYLCNQCLSPLTLWVQIPLLYNQCMSALKLWVWIPLMVAINAYHHKAVSLNPIHSATLCDKVCQW